MKRKFNVDHLKTWKKTVSVVNKVASVVNKDMNVILFDDLEKTERRLLDMTARKERRLQNIRVRNERYADRDAQNENSSNKIAELNQEKQQMKEEIALLKLKIDVLLNMLSQATAVTNIQHDELTRLRAQIGES